MKFYFWNMKYKFEISEDYWDELDNSGIRKNITFALSKYIELTQLSFLIFRIRKNSDVYIGKVFNKRRVTTFENAITLREIINLGKLNLAELINNTHRQDKARKILESTDPVCLSIAKSNEIQRALQQTNLVNDQYFKFDLLVGDYPDLIPQSIDAINTALSIFGLNPNDFPRLNEEQILDFDFNSIFPEPLERTVDGKLFFEHNNKRLYLQKVHRTPIEKCLGVDLIYNFIDDQRLIFIQYKCLTNEKKFYKSGDKHFPEELQRMKKIPGISDCQNFAVHKRENLRLCGCPVYIKLSAREIKGRRKTPYSFYYPICIWDFIYSSKELPYLTLDDQPRITNEHFNELVKAGLLGSLPNQSKDINYYLIENSKDERLKLIFEESKISKGN
jgi:hypothetical protein